MLSFIRDGIPPDNNEAAQIFNFGNRRSPRRPQPVEVVEQIDVTYDEKLSPRSLVDPAKIIKSQDL